MDGLNRPTASTGTPREELHGGAKKTVQMVAVALMKE